MSHGSASLISWEVDPRTGHHRRHILPHFYGTTNRFYNGSFMHFTAFHFPQNSPCKTSQYRSEPMPTPVLHRSDNRMCRGSGVRVSASLRRGAAPYADGCERFSGHSHLISLLLFAVLSDLRRGFYVTFRDTQCTIKSTLQYTF